MFKNIVVSILYCCLMPTSVLAFDDEQTHPLLTLEAADKALGFNNAIETYLGFEKGLNQELNNGEDLYPISKWLTKGSTEEDDPSCRASNHFHNPLNPWYTTSVGEIGAELTDPKFITELYCTLSLYGLTKYSNLVWATGLTDTAQTPLADPVNDEYGVNNGRNWSVARNLFYSSLIEQDSQQREVDLAETFRTLGYVLHLLQDTAVPAHTRNDFSQGHTNIIGCPDDGDCLPLAWVGNLFEGYVRDFWKDEIKPAITEKTSTPFVGDKTLTNFWDTDSVVSPQIGFNIGLAEYSNSNFISSGTIFKDSNDEDHYFAYPAKESITDSVYPDQPNLQLYEIWAQDNELDKVIYITKKNDDGGEVIDKFLKPRYILYEYRYKNYGDLVTRFDLEFTLDNKCYLDYAKKLIPRAIGYSAGLLDYFFRGTLEISAPDQLVYAIADGGYSPQQFSQIRTKVRNTSHLTDSTGATIPEEIGDGELYAVAKYRIVPNYMENLSSYPQSAEELATIMAGVAFSYSLSQPLIIDAATPLSSDFAHEFEFDFSGNEIPAGITDLTLQVVFRGALGNELDSAVAVGMQDLNEPAHFVYANSTDEIVMDGVLTTGNTIRNNPLLASEVDFDSDGIFNEVVIDENGVNIGEPYIDPYDVSIQIGFSTTDPALDIDDLIIPSVTIDHLPPARYSRILMLTDFQPGTPYYAKLYVTCHYSEPTTTYEHFKIFKEVTVQEENQIWQPPTPLEPIDYIHREAYQHYLASEYYCVGSPCLYLGAERAPYVSLIPYIFQ